MLRFILWCRRLPRVTSRSLLRARAWEVWWQTSGASAVFAGLATDEAAVEAAAVVAATAAAPQIVCGSRARAVAQTEYFSVLCVYVVSESVHAGSHDFCTHTQTDITYTQTHRAYSALSALRMRIVGVSALLFRLQIYSACTTCTVHRLFYVYMYNIYTIYAVLCLRCVHVVCTHISRSHGKAWCNVVSVRCCVVCTKRGKCVCTHCGGCRWIWWRFVCIVLAQPQTWLLFEYSGCNLYVCV